MSMIVERMDKLLSITTMEYSNLNEKTVVSIMLEEIQNNICHMVLLT